MRAASSANIDPVSLRSLRSLGDRSLLSRTSRLATRERNLEVDVLLHLIEVERRKLHLQLGHRSMFAYCTERLGYSDSAAGRKIQAARCLGKYPRLVELVREGKVSVSSICSIAKILTEENIDEILDRILGRPCSEIKKVVALYSPEITPRETLTMVRASSEAVGSSSVQTSLGAVESEDRSTPGSSSSSHAASPGSGASSSSHSASSEPAPAALSADSGAPAAGDAPSESQPTAAFRAESSAASTTTLSGTSPMPSAPPTPAPRTRPADSALRHRLVVYLDAETLAKLERAWALLSRGSRTKIDFALVLEKSVEAYLKDHCPVERDSRRRQRQEKKRGSSSASKRSESTRKVPSAPPAQSTPPRVAARRARRIPAAVRDSVYLRDGGACTFVSADGRRCGSTTGVEIDHWEPVARGGTNAIANLRCLCRAHNQYEADRVLGKSFMNSKRRRQGAARTERHSSIGTDGGPAPGTSEDICRGRFTPNAGENGSAMDPTN